MKLFCFISLCILPLYADVADNKTSSNNAIVDLALGLETFAEGVETMAEGVKEVSKGLRSVASAFRSLSKNVPISAFEETLLELAHKVITEQLSDRILNEIESMDNSSKDPHKHPFDEVLGVVTERGGPVTEAVLPVELTSAPDLPLDLADLVTDQSGTGLPGELEEEEDEEEEEEVGEGMSEETIFLPSASPVPLPVIEEKEKEEEEVIDEEIKEIDDIYATTEATVKLLTEGREEVEEEVIIIKVLKPLTRGAPMTDPLALVTERGLVTEKGVTEPAVLVTEPAVLVTEPAVTTGDSGSVDVGELPEGAKSAIVLLLELAEGEELADGEGPTEPEGPDDLMGDQCEGHHRQISEGCLNHYFRKLRCPYVKNLNWTSCYRYYEKCRKFQAKGNRSKGLKFCCQSLQCHQGDRF